MVRVKYWAFTFEDKSTVHPLGIASIAFCIRLLRIMIIRLASRLSNDASDGVETFTTISFVFANSLVLSTTTSLISDKLS